jgi:hypothetical protein
MTDWTEIEQARAKAHAKHGQNSIEGITAADPRWLSILSEEGGETSEATLLAWNALLQARIGRIAHEQTYDATGSLRGEIVDVLAVASAWLDALDGAPPTPPAEPDVCGQQWLMHTIPEDETDPEACVCQRLSGHDGDHICPGCSILHPDNTTEDI